MNIKPEIWHKITIPANENTLELLSNFLFEIGSQGIEELDGKISAFFDSGHTVDQLIELISNYFSQLGIEDHIDIHVEPIENRDWNAEWKKSYQCVSVSENILIKPSWHDTPKDAPQCVIEIDPEMAFGTGTHATTFLTMQLLEDLDLSEKSVLDVGTGTGILLIAAQKLGAKKSVGFDIDPIATVTALKNTVNNDITKGVDYFTGTIQALKNTTFDVILANVNRTQILKILPFLNDLLDYQGTVLLSGILRDEEEIIINALEKKNFSTKKIKRKDEWIALKAQKQNPG